MIPLKSKESPDFSRGEDVKEQDNFRDLFSYSKFIKNFDRVCSKHNQNCSYYRNRTIDIAAKRAALLACVIEIPYFKSCTLGDTYEIADEQGSDIKKLIGIPFTNDMLRIIQSMNGFDFVIVCMCPAASAAEKRDILCY